MTPAKRHLTYCCLLGNLSLNESHARQIAERWYGYEKPEMSFEFQGKRWATDIYSKLWWDGIRSVPSHVQNVIVSNEMAKRFELKGVAGFYFQDIWRLNISPSRGAILRPYRDAKNWIQGLLVYSYLNDKQPRLLTSRNLPKGTKAEMYFPERLAS